MATGTIDAKRIQEALGALARCSLLALINDDVRPGNEKDAQLVEDILLRLVSARPQRRSKQARDFLAALEQVMVDYDDNRKQTLSAVYGLYSSDGYKSRLRNTPWEHGKGHYLYQKADQEHRKLARSLVEYFEHAQKTSLEETVAFLENPEPRCPCVLVIDTSRSMRGLKLDELNTGLRLFAKELQDDQLASHRIEVAIVSFGGRVEIRPFVEARRFEPPELTAGGGTPMGEALGSALDLIRSRKDVYQAHGIPSWRPWLFLITDGLPTDPWEAAALRVRAAVADQSVTFYAIGVQGVSMTEIERLTGGTTYNLAGVRFVELFSWLSRSQESIARSSPDGDDPEPPGVEGWAAAG